MTGSTLPPLSLCGGHPALDFVNTIDPRTGPEPHVDHLDSFAALCDWCVHAGVISDASGLRVRGLAGGATALRRAVALREALFRVLAATVRGGTPEPTDLDRITGEAGKARLSLTPGDGGRDTPALHAEVAQPATPADVIGALGHHALDVLTRVDASRLRMCPGDQHGCGWIVLDTTRNRSRRWCDMGTCGSGVKAARLTERRRADRREP